MVRIEAAGTGSDPGAPEIATRLVRPSAVLSVWVMVHTTWAPVTSFRTSSRLIGVAPLAEISSSDRESMSGGAAAMARAPMPNENIRIGTRARRMGMTPGTARGA